MQNLRYKIQYLIALCLFGTTGLILRWTVLPSEVMVFLRGLLGSVVLLCFVCLRGRRPSIQAIYQNLGWLIFGGVSLGLNWVFLFAAYRYTTVAIASLCNYTAPIFVVLLSPFLFKEKLSFQKLLLVALAAFGIILISGVLSSDGSVGLTGILLGMGAAMGFVGIIVGNKKVSGISPIDRVIVQLFLSAATVLPYVLYQNLGHSIPWDVPSLCWMVVLILAHTAVAYSLYFGAMAVLPVSTIALWGYLEPVVSVLCSALILAEPLGISGILGSALILTAAFFSEK